MIQISQEDKQYLQWRCRVNWHPKYLKYVDEWIENTTQQQLDYILGIEQKHLIERGIYEQRR